ncbi:MAG TPA: hypothetical protein VNC50_17470, partial [Planctomycetia bacterium]|nr:hypothetical protein [Planctomycetia bacterium]
ASGRSGVAVELEDLRIDVQSIEPRTSQQQPTSSGMPSFLELDTDKNDYLTATELKAVVEEKAFALLDADRDKKVSSAEYNRFVGRRLRLRKASLTMGVTDLGQELFGSLDADSDGRLTRFELAAAPKLLERHKASMLGGKELPRSLTLEVTRGDLPQMGMMMRPNMMNMARTVKETPPAGPEWFKSMDANGDGLVDRGEFLGSAAQFAATDGDKDGFLTPAEAGKVKVAAKSK